MVQADLQGFGRHGGRIDDARRAYPDAPTPWIDLSTGINPNPWTPPVSIEIDPAPLPSIDELRGLEAAAARHFGVTAERVAAVPGSEVALRLLPALGVPKPIAAVDPCYGTHAEVADGVSETIGGRAGTLLIANPNNPDGRILPPSCLIEQAGGWLIVDEAFVDATPEHSLLPLIEDEASVLVTRSFGKFFGLAGVRLGFIVAPPAMLARMRRLLGDWPVSAQAIGWGTAAYSDTRWIAGARRELAERAGRLDAMLARHGLAAQGGSPLFRLVEHRDARALFDRLAGAGILTRPFVDRPDWLRFGLPKDEAVFDRLDRALAHG